VLPITISSPEPYFLRYLDISRSPDRRQQTISDFDIEPFAPRPICASLITDMNNKIPGHRTKCRSIIAFLWKLAKDIFFTFVAVAAFILKMILMLPALIQLSFGKRPLEDGESVDLVAYNGIAVKNVSHFVRTQHWLHG
jgi:hypothetical protein